MPFQQYYRYDSGLFPRRPSLLRVVGETIIAWADKREIAHARRQHQSRGSLQALPAYLRRDLGLPPLDKWPGDMDRW